MNFKSKNKISVALVITLILATMVCSFNMTSCSFISNKKESSSPQSTTNLENRWQDKKAVFLGDSITYGYDPDTYGSLPIGTRYWELLKDKLNLKSVKGYGISGSAFSTKSDNGYEYRPICTRYMNMDSDADLVVVFAGTNDYGHNSPLGKITDKTGSTFYGALNIVAKGLKEKYPNKTIVFITPTHRYGADRLAYDSDKNAVGCSLLNYVNGIKSVCKKHGLQVIDGYSISELNSANSSNKAKYMPDGLHFNEAGHRLFADKIYKKLINLK